MKFDVFLPSLLVPPRWFAGAEAPRLPAVETLLAHGVSRIGGEWPGVLLAAFGVDSTPGIAAFAALGDDIATGTQGWLFAEPAHLQANRGTLNVFPSSHLEVAAREATQLIDALNANFADRGLTFYCGTSGNWYVCCAVDELPQTTPIREAQRGASPEKLPQSRGKLSWKAIQNEAQMLFFSHAVNVAREAEGKLTINGLWFWGEGAIPATAVGWKPGIGAVFGDTPLARGLARWAHAQFTPLSHATMADTASHADHNVLLINALAIPHDRGDANAWRDAAVRLEAHIFGPLLASLRAGAIDEVVLTLPRSRDCLVFTVDAQSLRGLSGWWKNLTRKPQPFLEFSLA